MNEKDHWNEKTKVSIYSIKGTSLVSMIRDRIKTKVLRNYQQPHNFGKQPLQNIRLKN